MKNTIAHRVLDFLKKFPPFSFIEESLLLDLSKEVEIIYKEKDESIYQFNEDYKPYFYIVHKGSISLLREEENQKIVVDICDEGDIFGLRPLIAKEPYLLTARCYEESIIYAIPVDVFKNITENNQKISEYLIASFAANRKNPVVIDNMNKLDRLQLNPQIEIYNIQPISFSKNTLTCQPEKSVKEVAIDMVDKKVGATVILKDKLPIGIVTNKDLRNKIATGLQPITAKVEDIMSSPVITCDINTNILEAHIKMIKYDVSYLCITKDGTANSKLIGIVSLHDIIVSLGNSPSAFIRAIKRADSLVKIRNIRLKAHELLNRYLTQDLPTVHIMNMMNEINRAIIKRCIEFSMQSHGKAPVTFAWLCLGSMGRGEQLLVTDQDNALVYENNNNPKHKDYFLKLAQETTHNLHKIGFEYCPAEMMASNPKWCLSLEEWKKQFNSWLHHADQEAVLLSSIFFDYDFCYGEPSLVDQLTDSIYETNNKRLLKTLAQEFIDKPSPIGFFRQFLLEQDGEKNEVFNIKQRAIQPFIDAARILTLYHKIKNVNNTTARFRLLADIEPHNKAFFLTCEKAFKFLVKFRTRYGIKHNNSGKMIDLNLISKSEKLKLKNSFKPLKELHNILMVKLGISQIL